MLHLLVLVSCPWVGLGLAAEQGGVSHAAIVGIHVYLCPKTAGLSQCCALLHFFPQLPVLLHHWKGKIRIVEEKWHTPQQSLAR